MRTPIAALAAFLAAAPCVARPDEPPCTPGGVIEINGLGSPEDDLARVAELTGSVEPHSRLIRRGGSSDEVVCAGADFPWPPFATPRAGPDDAARRGPTVRALPLRLASVWNWNYPSGDNDGLLWAGRGLSQLLAAGGEARWGPFSAALAPEVTWSENRAFELVPNGHTGTLRFANAFYPGAIDLPQRFGAGPFATWGPGQSYLRVDAWNVGAGISTENRWFGPGVRNAIIMSNAGPGFPHVFLGTSRPADIVVGKAEALVFWGRLERTRFVANGGHPLINGLVLTYEPKWIPGLSLGGARVFVQRWKDLTWREWLSVFQTLEKKGLTSEYGPTGDNPFDNQIASLFGRWVFPESGLEIYFEWAREDYNWSWWSTIREPDWSQGYLVGLQKIFRAGTRVVRFGLELTDLQELAGLGSARGVPVYYVHGGDLDYTNRGQLLGAWIGPGADSQTFAVDVFHRGGRIGGYLERVRRNDAYYWEVIERTQGSFSHDAEVALGLRQALSVGRLEISWDASAAYRQNRDFLKHEPNLKLGVTLSLPLTRS